MHVKEFLRYWREGCSQRHIARTLGVSRITVRRYVAAARDMGLSPDGPEPTPEQVGELAALGRTGSGDPKAPARDRLAPHLERIRNWLEIEKLTLVRIRELLSDRGCEVSESSLRRFVREHGLTVPRTTVRMADRPPGQAAEMDYGKLGRIFDPDAGRERSVFALAVVLPYSRHMFLWPSYTQTLRRCDRGPGAGMGVLRRDAQTPGDRQLPGGRRRRRPLPAATDPGLYVLHPPPGSAG